TSEVILTAPDMREGEEDAFEIAEDKVKAFWKSRMDKYGTTEMYEKTVINSFKKQDTPEIIIVVDKLLTGFDAPRNTVLYLTRPLKEHTLLQAIARVNRLCPGKDYGYIIDYFGNLENLHNALETYSGDNTFDAEDIEGSWTNIGDEIKKLPQVHSDVWDIFKTIKNKYDEPAYEELLNDEELRHNFYEKVSIFSRILKMALSSFEFATKTDEKVIEKYKKDAKFFLALRIAVKRRYSDDLDYAEFEPQVQKLIDKHITTEGEVLRITDQVNIFDKQKREEEVEKLSSKAAKADHIASRTIRAINVKMNEDPVFYKKLSKLIKEAIEEYHQQRIDETEYLKKAKEFEETFLKGQTENIPEIIKNNPTGIAIFNLIGEVFVNEFKNNDDLPAKMAKEIDEILKNIVFDNGILRIDWQKDQNIESEILRSIDDYFFEAKIRFGIDFTFEKIDQMVEEVLKMAKTKFV
uniref:type I restriction enzyme subunit R domain-containing protein n=1 Tax=Flavobacterium sp. TaxID=239 RepID=UPI0040489EF5